MSTTIQDTRPRFSMAKHNAQKRERLATRLVTLGVTQEHADAAVKNMPARLCGWLYDDLRFAPSQVYKPAQPPARE